MRRRHVPLFWRLVVPNATVLVVAGAVLIARPAGSSGRVPILVVGVALIIAINALIVRRAVAPLVRLTAVMDRVDPLRPGARVDVPAPPSEVTTLAQAFNAMLDRLEAERRDAGHRALAEREAERRAIATELHDGIGQTMTALAMQADRLAATTPDPDRAGVEDLRDALLSTVEDVRRLAHRLRPEALDALGLVPALTSLAGRMSRQTGIPIVRRLDRALPPLDPDTELVVYRIAQESCTNAARHSGAGVIELTLRGGDDHVELAVRDDGRGWPAEAEAGNGVRGMRERALSIGARLDIAPRTDGPGTEVRLHARALRPG